VEGGELSGSDTWRITRVGGWGLDGSLFLRTFYFTGDKIEQKYIFLFYMSAQNYTRALKNSANPSFANFAGVIVVSYSTAQNMSRTRYTSSKLNQQL